MKGLIISACIWLGLLVLMIHFFGFHTLYQEILQDGIKFGLTKVFAIIGSLFVIGKIKKMRSKKKKNESKGA